MRYSLSCLMVLVTLVAPSAVAQHLPPPASGEAPGLRPPLHVSGEATEVRPEVRQTPVTIRPAVAFHVGTTGLGADFAIGVHKNLGFRAGGSFFPLDFNITSSDIDYSLSFASPQFLLAVDVYPAGTFRFTGGLLFQQDDFDISATPAEPVEIGDVEYQPDQIGSLMGTLDTRAVSPYLGLGFGSPNKRGVGFFLDLGVAFHGEPVVSVTANGPIATVPQFQQDLAEEVAEIQDDVSKFTVLPVVRLGLMIGFGR